MYEDRWGKRVAWMAILIVLAFAIGAGLISLANSVGDPITRTRSVPAPLLKASSSLDDARARFEGKPAQSVPGTQLGLEGGTCDVFPLSDAVAIICHA